MKNKYILGIIVLIILLTLIISKTSRTINSFKEKQHLYKELNKETTRNTINENVLPLIENDNKYIELQTLDWIKQREEKGYCYGLLEKDKIVMAKWIEKFNINVPKIYYYDYHTNFTFDKFEEIFVNNPDKKFIVKISHLQSSYGIIIVEPYNKKNKEYLLDIYDKCLNKFKTCFVCNHDKNTAPKNYEIKNGIKESHYKLYETIEPGILIQEYFNSYKDETTNNVKPLEIKVLVYGDKIINDNAYKSSFKNQEKYKFVYQMAKNISKILGSSLIRVDMFIKETDDPYIPYLNEISLSPNGGFKSNYLDNEVIKKYKKEVKNYQPVKMEIDELIKSSPKRTIPIEKYLTDNEWNTWWNEKISFGLIDPNVYML
jgi:hypothetical protein